MTLDNKHKDRINPKVKDVLALLGAGAFLTGSLIMPGLPVLAKPFLDKKRKEEANEWKKFNTWRLKQMLKRLEAQKMVEVSEDKDGYNVKITEKGRRRLLKYNIDEMTLTNKKWDGKWRIIAYDIHESNKKARNYFRTILKKLEFLKLQKSMYLTPYKCEDEIEYIRQIFDIGNNVTIIKVNGIENESAYKDYFGLS